MSIDPAVIRATMRLWASGVTVVTTAQNGQYVGVTVSSFTSVSLTPPLALVCLYKHTESCKAVLDAGVFAVSILGEGQGALSEQFAGHNKDYAAGEDRFHNVATSTKVSGAPVLDNAIAWLDCRVTAAHDGGTHWVIIGEILATGRRSDEPKPLVYYNRAYRTVTP
ncbi:MAG: flavin reductase family protein [Chloroflexi bacterium]|nr:flavin reductase family protein [Chloroflexota bacterium]